MNAPAKEIRNKLDQQTLGVSSVIVIPLHDSAMNGDETRQSVMEFLGGIRDYHAFRNFSHLERFGEPDPWSSTIIPNLESTINKISLLFEESTQTTDKQLSFSYALNVEMRDSVIAGRMTSR